MLFVRGRFFHDTKKIYIALTTIYGIGITQAKNILKKLNINENLRVYEINNDIFIQIFQYLNLGNYKIENELRKYQKSQIRELIFIKSYRGRRHYSQLPVRGQRTHSNCQTCKIICMNMV